MHPRSKHWHLLDYVIVRRSDRRDVQLTRAMRGAECWTDHRLVRASNELNIRLPIRKRQPKKRLHVRGCSDPSKVDLLRENIHAKLQSHPDPDPLAQRDTEKLSAEWADLSNCIMDAATASFGFSTKKSIKTGSMTSYSSGRSDRRRRRRCCHRRLDRTASCISCTPPPKA